MPGHGEPTTSGQVRGPSRRSFDYIVLGAAGVKVRTSREKEGVGSQNESKEGTELEQA